MLSNSGVSRYSNASGTGRSASDPTIAHSLPAAFFARTDRRGPFVPREATSGRSREASVEVERRRGASGLKKPRRGRRETTAGRESP
eukprot:31327-Pelagococcus_subviridis.AAC.6